jgi:hypothetical protein
MGVILWGPGMEVYRMVQCGEGTSTWTAQVYKPPASRFDFTLSLTSSLLTTHKLSLSTPYQNKL